ncbi:methylamine dehydrogenase accessory protein MauD [Pseudomonas sp. DCB_AW]|uniref:methylamine dehydrogenase accessory protein MauD n=1 Tax=Pseudomonas sp. DCB_AW TaxID=2993596 RepID=UPI002248FD0D|nr:methylamine dehydrogenase accessory protein MauD [Pseudomonas sp. DCB_AW]MCX2689110.1 methylamine dehydrogenase accessory protein MauD [Pseudomonas sp. DCB_AW]
MQLLIASNILLWLLLIAVAFTVMALVRQIGVLHGRIAPAGALMVDKGVTVNDPAPQVTAADRHGRPVNIGYRSERSQLLFFLAPGCPVCKSLLPAIKSIAKDNSGELDVIYVSDGDFAEQQALIDANDLQQATYVVGPEIGMTYQIGKLPYAVLIDQAGTLRAKGLVNSREHLDSLFETVHLGSASLQQYLHSNHAQGHAHDHEHDHAHPHSAQH